MPRWDPDLVVDPGLARRLIAAQFPALAGASLRPFGSGWDNAAYLLDERFVFRFPQRAIAAPLMVKELACLPLLAPQLALPIPAPHFAGVPSDGYPWQFGGYVRLAGETACSRDLTDDARGTLAGDLGRFLRELHDVDPAPLRAAGLPDDEIGKLDPARLGLDEPPLEGEHRAVHGDLYARHLLLDAADRLAGAIDWGDLHYGHPAVDLSVVHMLVPAHFHDAFFATYGDVDPRAWRFARARARHHAGFALEYANAVGDERLRAACIRAREYAAP